MELRLQQCLSPPHLLLWKREDLPHHYVFSFFTKATLKAQFEAHRAATVLFPFLLLFSDSGFHFNVQTLV